MVAAGIAGAAASLMAGPSLGSVAPWGLVLLFALWFSLMEKYAISLPWRRQRIRTALNEPVLLVGLLAMGPAEVLVASVLGRLATGVVERRAPVKTAFNVAQAAVATSLAALATVTLGPLVGHVIAACVGMLVSTAVSEMTLAAVMASVENASWRGVVAERFVSVGLTEAVYGLAGGLILAALWSVHPAAPLLMLPFAWVLLRYEDLGARAERENDLLRRLARDLRDLSGCSDEVVIATRMLETVDQTMGAGRASIRLPDGRHWDHRAAVSQGPPDVEVPIHLKEDAGTGVLSVWRRPGRPRFTREDEAALHTIAAHAGTAFDGAEALHQVSAQRVMLARQEKYSTLGTLIAGVAHEINNPLTYLSGNLELAMMELDELKRVMPGPEVDAACAEVARQLGIANDGASRIGYIVKALRVVARQRPASEREAVDLNRLAEDVATVMLAGVPAQVSLVVLHDSSAPPVLAHSPDLHQVVLNLAKNAVEALGARSGTVTLRVRHDAGHAYLDVEDDGPGIPAELRGKLFTPFFTTKEGGTGLGLALAQGIARDHGGELRLRSEEGSGTTFTLAIPLGRRPGGATSATEIPLAGEDGVSAAGRGAR